MKNNLLRTAILLFAFNLLFVVGGKAQWVSIPDTSFGMFLKTNGYSTCVQGNNLVGWQMDTTCNAVVTANYYFDIINKNVHDLTGIQYFKNITGLRCDYNNLPFLPPLPKSLRYLSCYNNSITSLPFLPDSLTDLECSFNNLYILPNLPVGLVNLFCGGNHLTSLPILPDSLSVLDCSSNRLDSLPALPNSIEYLYLADNPSLRSITQFPPYLIELSCGTDSLDSLPALPSTLQRLNVAGNQLSELPQLPNNLWYLYCNNNRLTSLPTLPFGLTTLYCSGNSLTTLPSLPNQLYEINASYNPLISLPDLPDSLYSLNVTADLSLHCLPKLNIIDMLLIDGTGLQCLPNVGKIQMTDVALPICDQLNTNSCPVYWNAHGKVFFDSDNNCIADNSDSLIKNIQVLLKSGTTIVEQQNTKQTGDYNFDLPVSTLFDITLDTVNLPFIVICPDTGKYSVSIASSSTLLTDIDFALSCKPGYDLVAQSINGRFVPGNTRPINITAGDFTNFCGAHCAAGVNGSVQLVVNGAAHYASPAIGGLTPTTVVNDTITWSIPDFGAVDFFTAFNINVATDTTAVLGSHICFTLIVNPIAGDNNPANNILTHCFPVVGSFDPNEKEVYPAGNIDTATHWLTYTIHFQNTGTAEAQHIYVTDTLDSNIDAASFQLLAYSHQPNVQLKGNNLRFNFPNINLPDSNTSEPLSHGYVQYKVKLKDNLPLGTNITNTAFIYFDFNAPVVTNTVGNTIALATGLADFGFGILDFGLHPNPATNSVTVSINETLLGSNLTLTDITGRQVAAVQLSSTRQQLSIASFAPGLYFATIETKQGKATRKLIKQ